MNPLSRADFYHRQLGIADDDRKSLVLLALSEVLEEVPEYRGGVWSRPGYDGQVLGIEEQTVMLKWKRRMRGFRWLAC